jgi:hypothetical protein
VSSRLPGDAESPARPPRSARLGVHAPAPAASFRGNWLSSMPIMANAGAAGARRGAARGALAGPPSPGRRRAEVLVASVEPRGRSGAPLEQRLHRREAEPRRLRCSVRCRSWVGCARVARVLWGAECVWTTTLRRVPRVGHPRGPRVTCRKRDQLKRKRQSRFGLATITQPAVDLLAAASAKRRNLGISADS